MAAVDNEHVLHGPKFLEAIPKVSYGQTIFRRLHNNYSLPLALVDAITRKSLSYQTIFEQSLRLAHSLRKYGITLNDVIAISSENNLNYAIPLIAGLWLGSTVTLFNPLYTLREVMHVMSISKPSIIFCSKMSLQLFLKNQKELKCIKKIIVIDDGDFEGDVESMEAFIFKNSLDYKQFVPVDVDSQNVALILYSSGTTGLPKGVMLTHYNLHAAFMVLTDPRYYVQWTPGTWKTLGLMPFFHAYGFTLLVVGLLQGYTIVSIPKFEPLLFLKTIQDFKIKSLPIVPPLVHFLAYNNLVNNYDLTHLEEIISGAAPLSRDTEELLLNRFKNILCVRQGYGLTESTVGAAIATLSYNKPGSCGRLVPETSAKVIDTNTGRSLGPCVKGELCIKGPQLMKGYAGDISSTHATIDKDGWLRSGDIAYYDKDGFFYIVDRLKDLIKYKGFQVAPAELEALLIQHPKIADTAVIGIPDEIAGEAPLAFVVKIEDQHLTEDDVKNFIAERVSPQKRLHGGVQFVQMIPKSASGKILKKELRQLLAQKSKL